MECSSQVYLINRYDRPDRLTYSINQLRRIGLSSSVTRVEACLPDEAESEKYRFIDTIAYQNIVSKKGPTGILPTWGSVACLISHYRTWKLIRDRNELYAIVCEDDISFKDPSLFKFLLHQAENSMKNRVKKADLSRTIPPFKDSVMISLGGKPKFLDRNCENNFQSSLLIEYNAPFTGLSFYLISLRAVHQLIDCFQPCRFQLDIQLGINMRDWHQSDKTGPYVEILGNPTALLDRDSKFESDVQPIQWTKNKIMETFTNLPDTTCSIIFEYIAEIDSVSFESYLNNDEYTTYNYT